jgi:hypothetical protein
VITIYEQDGEPGNVQSVCDFASSDSPEDGDKVTIHALSESNSSGITGTIAVNWSKIDAGIYYRNMWGYLGYEFDIKAWDIKSSNILLTTNSIPELSMPSEMTAVVNNTLQIFFNGIIKTFDYTQYEIEVICDVGEKFKRYYEITPSAVGSHDMTINLKSLIGTTLATKTVVINVIEKVNNPTSQKNVMLVGDSLSNNVGDWADLLSIMTVDGTDSLMGSISNTDFIGELGTAPKQYTGYSGWEWSDYNSDLSPFWDGSSVNFLNWFQTNYAAKYSAGEKIDVAVFMLAWNTIANVDFDLINAKIVIDRLHSDFPDCKIVLMGAHLSSHLSNRDWINDMDLIFKQNNAYQELVDESTYTNFVEWVQTSALFDSENMMRTFEKQVNVRSTDTELINNDIHPGHTATSNYYQLADNAMRELIKLLCN